MDIQSRIIDFDVEVFQHGWSVNFRKDDKSKTFKSDGTDGEWHKVKDWLLKHNPILCGFNNKHYDRHILRAITEGHSVDEIKELNDFIIEEKNQGWQWSKFVPFSREIFDSMDIRDDLRNDMSLKAIEGNLGLPIVESSVPFDLDRPLTDEEWEEVLEYNQYDVEATQTIRKLREDYFQSKLTVAEMFDIDPVRALGMTNAKLTAEVLGAERVERFDEREYVYPDNLKLNRIPEEVREFFDHIYDESIDDATLFSSKWDIPLGGVDVRYGFGGVHGARENFHLKSDENVVILNYDVTSLYPFLMILYNYISRNVADPTKFSEIVERRVQAKAKGDDRISGALKLIINTTYGAMLEKFNKLYDPLMGRSVCITGQLLLTDLVVGLLESAPSLGVINFNTDGIMFYINKDEIPLIEPTLAEWQKRTGLELEKDEIKAIYQKDVNNYIIEKTNGKISTKGAYVVAHDGFESKNVTRRIENGSLVIVAKAIVNYFLHGTHPRETINASTNPLEFQMIAKTGFTYVKTVHATPSGDVDVQKVNRVYASLDQTSGTLYKVRADGGRDKVASIPDHVIIDNDNQVDIKQIDKQWYVDLATKRIHDYLGTLKRKGEQGPSMLDKIAPRKLYLKKDDEVRVVEKGQIVPTSWQDAEVITKKVHDEFRAQVEEPSPVEEEIVESEVKIEKEEEIIISEKAPVQGESTMEEPVSSSPYDLVPKQQVSLLRKIHALRKYLSEMDWTKDGVNQHSMYKYISGDQYKRNLNEACLAVGLEFIVNIYRSEFIPKGDVGASSHLVRIVGDVQLHDIDTGMYRTYAVHADGADTLDKGVYKAMTGMVKYFISNNFLVGENVDPEEDTPPAKPAKSGYTSPAKREAVKEEIMSTDEPASSENKKLIKSYRDTLATMGETDVVAKINKVMSSKPTNNQAIDLIMELEELI